MLSDELERLQQLHQAGALSDTEFQQAKQRVLEGSSADFPNSSSPQNIGLDTGVRRICGLPPNTWFMLMHLSQLLTLAGGLGIAIPLVMWAISKDDSRDANQHGLVIINWIISELIYTIVGGLLCFVVIGIPIVIALAVASIAFPIIGAIKANSGQVWRYPLTIPFFDDRAAGDAI